MIHVVTDRTSDITRTEAAALGVTVVPLVVRFGDEQFRDGVDIEPDAFYAKLQSTTVHPVTSQPSPQQFAAVYRDLLGNPADHVVSLHISGKLSGTVQSAHLARQEVDATRVHIVDTESVSGGLQLLVRAALDDIAAGCDSATVAERALRRRAKVGILVLLDTLTYLQRGGRIGRAQALVGSLLSIKPLLTVTDGEVAPLARLRSHAQGIDRIIELLRARGTLRGIAVFHAAAPRLVDALRARVAQAEPAVPIIDGRIGPVVGAYTGPGGSGLASLGAD